MKTRNELVRRRLQELQKERERLGEVKLQHTHVNEPSEHTPGPWKVSTQLSIVSNVGGYPTAIAECFEPIRGKGPNYAEGEANAHLIAAAPEMLEALKAAQMLISVARQYFPKSVRRADRFNLENTCAAVGSAIAKAEGRE